ncbi:histone-like nucleoid-structuring protein Lsr2 [Streptomyces sp. L2]|uniref:Lsr2 family DNA-binding protein n=1 Tax=Streptomyces sp. L2 TaxID=2162665 RepID=UPI0010121DFA|nr:histone-like nucleoid-structuring protein Lsr2 [Streptomyces sp. L2]
MTIAALRNLLAEIDAQGGPEAARRWRLDIPDTEGTPDPMTTTTDPGVLPPLVTVRPPAPDEDPERLPVGRLLAWGDQRDDPEVQAQAARARAALVGLRARYAADRELSALAAEREQLEQRLAEVQAREQQLAPVKPKRKSPEYDAQTVRAWADDNGIECPSRGRVPKQVLEAWRAAQAAESA